VGGQRTLDRAPKHRLPEQRLNGCMDGSGLHRLLPIRQHPDYRFDDPARPAVSSTNGAGCLAWMRRPVAGRNFGLPTRPVEQDPQGSNRVGERPYKVHHLAKGRTAPAPDEGAGALASQGRADRVGRLIETLVTSRR
jgi:hypothetical protein